MFLPTNSDPELYWPLQGYKRVDRWGRCLKTGIFRRPFLRCSQEHCTFKLMLTTIYWNDWKVVTCPLCFLFHTTESIHFGSNRIQSWNQMLTIFQEPMFNCRCSFVLLSLPVYRVIQCIKKNGLWKTLCIMFPHIFAKSSMNNDGFFLLNGLFIPFGHYKQPFIPDDV